MLKIVQQKLLLMILFNPPSRVKNSIVCFLSALLLPTILGCSVEQPKSDTEVDDGEVLVWSDEFDGEELDTTKWKYETGATGWGNKEWQDYRDEGNVEVSDGTLKITAKLVGEGQKVGDYTSARINSIETFTYGRYEIRAKMPDWKGKGNWPAIWMLGEDLRSSGWPRCGEIDILEYVSYQADKVHFNFHSKANNHMNDTNVSSGPVTLETAEEEFHNYGILWTETKIQCYLDTPDNITLSFDRPAEFDKSNWPFDHPFYFILNVAVGGGWGGLEGVDDSIFPATMEVDYVRVYQKKK